MRPVRSAATQQSPYRVPPQATRLPYTVPHPPSALHTARSLVEKSYNMVLYAGHDVLIGDAHARLDAPHSPGRYGSTHTRLPAFDNRVSHVVGKLTE